MFAVLSFLIATVVRFQIDSFLPPGFPYLTFLPAVILTSFLAGTGPAILCAALSGCAAWYWFLAPIGSFNLTPQTALALAFYVLIISVDIAVIDAMRRYSERLRVEQKRSASLAERQKILFSELQHRVANNLSFVSSMLLLQKMEVSASPESAPRIFQEAMHRLDVMSRLHRRLHASSELDKPVAEYLTGLYADLAEVMGAKHIDCVIDADDIRLDLDRLTALSLILTELMTNALKHAFSDREGGSLHIGLKYREGNLAMLSVSDGGPGFRGEAGKTKGKSLGMSIVESLCAQLDGQLLFPCPGEPSCVRVIFKP